MGDTWVHLRLCRECGHVGCCDDSKNKHATKHFHATKHPIMTSPTRAAREAQMFPLLEPEEVARLRRFGAQRHYANGTRISETGKQMPGLLLVLSGTGEGAAAVAQIHPFPAKQPSVPAHA